MLIEKTLPSAKADSNPLRILESIPDGFISVDSHWTIQYCNRNSEKILGIPRENIIGLNLWICFPGCEHLKFFDELLMAMERQQPVFFQEYYMPLELWVEVSAYFADGLLSIYFKDISVQKEQDRKLKEINQCYNHLMRFVSTAVWDWEIGTATAVWHGDSLTKLLGYQPEEKRTVAYWEESVHPDDLPKVKQTFQTTLLNGESYYTNQYRIREKSGKYIYVCDRASIIRDANGSPVKVIGVTDDITVQKQYEAALIEAKESYQSLFHNAPLPQWIYDSETLRFLDVNTAAIQHYGYTYNEFLQMSLPDIRPEKDRQKAKETVHHRRIDGVANRGTWTHIKKNGEPILVEISLTLIHFQNKTAHLATLNDVTEKLNLQKQLNDATLRQQKSITKAALAAQERERSEIARELHDGINQVLTTAKLYIENIEYFPEQKKVFIDKSISLLQKSINEIRVLSKALVTPTITDIGFKEALSEMIKCYQELNLFEMNYTIQEGSEKIEHEVKLTVYRIIQEQLNNIVKHAKASIVKIQVLLKGQQFVVLIEDNGLGFNIAQKKTGIGLCNMKNRAELFKGKVTIKSAPGEGCKIEIAFPL